MHAAFVYTATSDLSQISMSFLLLKWGWVTPETTCRLNIWCMLACPNLQEHLILTWCGVPHIWEGCWGRRDREDKPALCVPQEEEVIGAVPWQFCVSKFYTLQACILQKFCPAFHCKHKGHKCDFVIISCIDPYCTGRESRCFPNWPWLLAPEETKACHHQNLEVTG